MLFRPQSSLVQSDCGRGGACSSRLADRPEACPYGLGVNLRIEQQRGCYFARKPPLCKVIVVGAVALTLR